MGYSSGSVEEVFFWLKVSTPGFTFLHVFTLHFVLKLTDTSRKIPHFVCLLIYVPSLFFTWYGFTHPFVFNDFMLTNGYWIGIPMLGSPVFLFFMLQYLAYYIVSAVLLFVWIRKNTSVRIKRQGIVMMFSILSTILIYNVEPFVLPLFTGYKTLVISVNAGIIWVAGFWIAILRYSLFTWDQYRILHEIFNALEGAAFLLDKNMKIIAANRNLANIVKLRVQELKGQNIKEFIDSVDGIETARNTDKPTVYFCRITSHTGSSHSFRFSISPMHDRYEDFYGYLVMGSEIFALELFQERYKLSSREMELLHDITNGLSGKNIAEKNNITLNTVKSHMTHIYNKTGTNNRMELLKLLSLYEQKSGNISSIFK